MFEIILGFGLALISSVTPGLSPYSAGAIGLSLGVFGLNPSASITVAIVAYLASLVTSTSKSAYAPMLAGSVEASNMIITNPNAVVNAKKIQQFIAWVTVGSLTFFPLLIHFGSRGIGGWTESFPVSASIGVAIAIYMVMKNGPVALVYVGLYAGAFWLLRNSLFAAFVIGAGFKILPSALFDTKHEAEDDENEPVDIHPVMLLSNVMIGYVYTIGVQGLSASGLDRMMPGNSSYSMSMAYIRHIVCESILIGYFAMGEFTGRSGVAMFSQPTYTNLELIFSVALFGIVWIVFLSDLTNAWWKTISGSKSLHSIGKNVSIGVVIATLIISTGIFGTALALGLALIPLVVLPVFREREMDIDLFVYSLPMIN